MLRAASLAIVAITMGASVATASPGDARHQELLGAREAALEAFHARRNETLENYTIALHAIQQSFDEGQHEALHICGSYKACHRIFWLALAQKARVEMARARLIAQADLARARIEALESFASAKAAADAKYG